MSLSALNAISFKQETTFGTAVVPNVSYPIESEDLHVEGGIGIHGPVQANRASSIAPYAQRKNYVGTLGTFIYPEEFGWLFKGLLGDVSSAVVTGSIYKHTFSVTTDIPSFTFEKNAQVVNQRYAGSKVNSMTINYRNNEEVSVSIPVIAKTMATATAISPSWPTIRPFVAVDVSVKIAANKAGLAAATADGDIENCTITIANDLETKYGLNGSQDPNRIIPKRLKVSGSFDKYFSGTTELDAYLARTQKALGIYCTGDVISGSDTYQFNIELADVRFMAHPVSTGLNEVIVCSIEFEAFYDVTDSEVIEATLQNTTASYV